MPTFPPAPGRFSTTTGCPSASPSGGASVRQSVSTTAPGGKGLTRRIGFDGQPCARAAALIHIIARTIRAIHTSTMKAAPIRPSAAPSGRRSSARERHSAITSSGTSFTTRTSANGSSTISSSRPSTGMKSGIRSIGLSTYATIATSSAFAYQGVRGASPRVDRQHLALQLRGARLEARQDGHGAR
jgi:hypothetical protein